MERQPLDSLEYESTYLELRPVRERLSHTTDVPLLARLRAGVQMNDAIASHGIAAAGSGIAVSGPRTTPASPPDLSPRMAGGAPAQVVHRPAGSPASLLHDTSARRYSRESSGQLISPHRRRYRTLLVSSLLVVASASLGVVADLDLRATRALFVALTGVLLLGWARLAWRGKPRAEPFGSTASRVLDRLVTAVGTFFAIALWASYAPQASAAFSKTVVLVMCCVGLIGGLVATSRALRAV
jgi:hypothetical protein